MQKALTYFWIIIQLIIGYNLLFPFVLYCIYLLSKSKRSKTSLNNINISPDFAVIITAYQYVNSLPQVVSSVLNLNYDKFLVYVVADNCDTSSLNFTDERVVLFKPEEILRSNTKSHFYAINRFKRKHDIVTIIDSDNIVDSEYLNELTFYFNKGYEAVQGTRNAKNLDTTYACLDAARDIYYHFYDCKVLFHAGSSSTLSGSGMAFTTQLYKDCLANERIMGAGFDKVLQAKIIEKNKRIAFAPKAIVYDEKTSQPDQLINQRSRWINTWFKYFKLGFSLIAKGIKRKSLNQTLFGFVLLRPPLFLFLLLSALLMIANLFINPLISLLWMFAFIVFIGCFIKSLTTSEIDKRIYKSLLGIPIFMFYQLISLTRIRKANTRSVSTKHHHI